MKKRVSKADWLEKALGVLERDGIDAIKIEHLAKELNVAKSGFYWHFKNRQTLVRAMVEYWGNEFTNVMLDNVEVIKSGPKDRLHKVMEMLLEYDLADLELHMWTAAEKDSVARAMVDQVYKKRFDFIHLAFSEMGFKGEDLDMRTRLFQCYHTWEGVMYRDLPKAKRAKCIQLRLELLCTQPNKDVVS